MTIEDLYAALPVIECKGLCARSCGPVMSTDAEAVRAQASVRIVAPGVALWDTDRKRRCHKLRYGRCTIYDLRPAICRLWGLVETMRCPWGCVPERVLTVAEGHAFLAAIRDAAAEHER